MAGVLATLAGGTAAWFVSLFNGGQSPLQSSYNNITSQLGPRLSLDAAIYFPGSAGFEVATDRWVPWNNPHFDVVVEVVTEEDVTETVRRPPSFKMQKILWRC